MKLNHMPSLDAEDPNVSIVVDQLSAERKIVTYVNKKQLQEAQYHIYFQNGSSGSLHSFGGELRFYKFRAFQVF